MASDDPKEVLRAEAENDARWLECALRVQRLIDAEETRRAHTR